MEFLLYDIRVAVLIAVFYMFYRLLLSRDSLHQLNRFVLLGTAVASFVLPLCVITVHHTEVLTVVPSASTAMTTTVGKVAEPSTPWWQIALPIVFWLGVIITLLYTILSISKVCILISRCEKHRQDDGTVIAVTDGEVSPFSWMHYIVMSRSDYAHPDSAILMHEREHIRRHHSWDVLLVDILSSLQWFNPAMWILRSDLRAIHEYEADAAVLSNGVNARQYQYLLVRKAMAAAGYSIANGINHSALKQRITMMNTHKQNKYSWLKALYVLPIIAVSLFATARTVTDYKVMPTAKVNTPAEKAVKTDAQVAKVLKTVESKDSLAKDNTQVDADLSSVKDMYIDVDGKECSYRQLGLLAPSDIKSITILKDKQAIAKYGDKAKNGALVVKTVSGNGLAKIIDAEQNKVWDVSDQMPSYKGGSSEMFKFFASIMKYPAVAQKYGVQGRVVVQFIVNEDGSISDAHTVANITKGTVDAPVNVVGYANNKDESVSEEEKAKGIEEGKQALANEAVRIISAMPKWRPGLEDGKPVKVKYNVPVTFKLM